MKASVERPIYTAKIVHESGTTATTYHLKDITTDLLVSHPENELAEKVDISLVNIKVGNDFLRNLISVKDKMYVYANTGSGEKEVFRGFVWERTMSEDADSNDIRLLCYDRLIYLHKSKDTFFAKSGKLTKGLIESIASKWGFKISYKYVSITHGKLSFHNDSVADIIISILDEAKKQKGAGYVIYMDGDTIVIDYEGNNKTVYKLTSTDNTISTRFSESMEDMVTKVLIVKAETISTEKTDNSNRAIIELAQSYMAQDSNLSYADAIARAKESLNSGGSGGETGRYLTVDSVSKNTDKYGTLQQILVLGKDENLSDAKTEANQTLKDNATPKKELEVESVDIPWVKKGDQIYISAGSLNGYYVIKSIEHDALKYSMNIEVSVYG